MTSTILVVDDDPQILRMLKTSLQTNGYDVQTALHGVAALEQMQQHQPDLVITDLSMPVMNGVELTQKIRESSRIPIIVLSVRDSDQSKVIALDEGADDYVTKPFHIQELLARIRAHLRRMAPTDEEALPKRIQIGDFDIDPASRVVKVRGAAVHLSPKEFDLLLLFVKNPLRVMTHKVLLRSIWGPRGTDQPEYLRVLVAQLRRKIEGSPDGSYIQSEPWVGYRFHPSGSDDELTTS